MKRFQVGALEVRIFEDDVDLASAAADDAAEAIRDALRERGTANVMFASGVSQLCFLEALTALGRVDWPRVTGFHMDEYVGLPGTDPESLQAFMRIRIAERVPLRAFYFLSGDSPDPSIEAAKYGSVLREHPLDVCCLGIGTNGHLAFNDPHVADFDDPLDAKVVDLDEVSRMQQVCEGHFANLSEVPSRAITVTIPALMRARRAIALAMGYRKAEPVRVALKGDIGAGCPASVLRRHQHADLYLDADAASLL